MLKESKRKSSEDLGTDGGRPDLRAPRRCPQTCQAPTGGSAEVRAAPQVPQVTITPEGGGSSREIQPEDLDDEVERSLCRKLSNSSISSTGSSNVDSEDDVLSDNESKSKGLITLEHLDPGESRSWWKLKTYVRWPFNASQRKNWVQLAGHKGNFKAADKGRILKRFSENEKQCFEKLSGDVLVPFVPAYHGVVEKDGESFLQLDDLLANFENANVMDCKMGFRTYLEEDIVQAKERPRPREDLYNKMVEVNDRGPTPEEHSLKAVTKYRYMKWREAMSSTMTLGFRIEGIKKQDGTCQTDFKKIRLEQQIIQLFKDFVGGDVSIIKSYLLRLKDIRQALNTSEFFKKHEVIGSSLLFIHDHTGKAQVWIIDFGRTTALPEGKTLSHDIPWKEGNREDGYLLGLENLYQLLESISNEGTKEDTCSQTTETRIL
ncbi:inositol-trisphosphate 3-kinase A [Nothobranchius furzeri]|uniref:Kinase n=1 Tax=Nothobranchius furzeri TaxID=105023 RepID=A0A1A7ZIP3_NOTFU|nr:inositol-trisphosphate 3-kinase A [Nothobranchius furzeri]KAF7201750.1 inositol-trisphosphate 3-kinase A [Nothobranchius furzeri]